MMIAVILFEVITLMPECHCVSCHGGFCKEEDGEAKSAVVAVMMMMMVWGAVEVHRRLMGGVCVGRRGEYSHGEVLCPGRAVA